MNVPVSPSFADAPAEGTLLAELMARSWRENSEQPLDYSSEFLRSLFDYPGMSPALAPALMEGNRPQAWVAAYPRLLAVDGEVGRYGLMTFFTVAPELKGRGLGVAVWAECLRRANQAGFDGVLHYCVEGNVSNKATQAGARRAGFSAAHVFTVAYLMRFLRPAPAVDAPPLPNEALAFLCESARLLSTTIPLARQWTIPEAGWQLRRRLGACAEWSPDGALLAGYVMRVADAEKTPCLFLDEIHWGGLSPEGRAELLKRFLARAGAKARLVVVPLLGYADMTPFQAAGFRRSPRVLQAYLTRFRGEPAPPAAALYADVL